MNALLNNEIESELIYPAGPEGCVDYPEVKQFAELALVYAGLLLDRSVAF